MSKIAHMKQQFLPYNEVALELACEQLKSLPALVSPQAIQQLRNKIACAQKGEAFVLQLGDCAERFSESLSSVTELKHDFMSRLQERLNEDLPVETILIGRIAGQYGKPRSVLFEKKSNECIYTYHGDLINKESFVNEDCRKPDPRRLLQAYQSAKNIINDLRRLGASLYTSHEAFFVNYEQALSRQIAGKQYNVSTHFPWLGMRNCCSNDHIDYLASIENPVGVKVGPSVTVDELIALIDKLNPKNHAGKLVLITRLGALSAGDSLPALVKAVNDNKKKVLWLVDPLHANTQSDAYGKKYRLVPDAVKEVMVTIDVLSSFDTPLGGVHLEATYHNDVLECVYTEAELTEGRFFQSALDPRLNAAQSVHFIDKMLAHKHLCSHLVCPSEEVT